MTQNIKMICCFAISSTLVFGLACKKKTNTTTNTTTVIAGNVASYGFDGNANDLSGNNKHGTVYGAVAGTDRKGNPAGALSFDGVNDEVLLSASSFCYKNYSYALWYKGDVLPATGSAYYLFAIGSAGADHNILLANSYGTTIGFAGGSSDTVPGSPPYTLVIKGILPAMSVWHHLVMTRDNDNLKLYIDGQVAAITGTKSTLPDYNWVNDFVSIGSRNGKFFTKGTIDDVKIFNRAISAADVTTLYGQ